jgi:hypothetical protein
MSKIAQIPIISENLFQYWSRKYGLNETIIISAYVKKLAIQFPERYKLGQREPFKVTMIIEFHFKQMHSIFPELKKDQIRKALESLKKQGLFGWHREIEKADYLFILEHERLVQEMLSFEDGFYA